MTFTEEIPFATLPTSFGGAKIYGFRENDKEHCAIVFWDIVWKKDVICRVHSSCITGDVFHSQKCDCGQQLEFAMNMISKTSGIIIYLDHEGRGIGLVNKIRAYALQDSWLDTVEANQKLWLPIDDRKYGIVKDILAYLKISSIQLLTNNPDKIYQLQTFWISISKNIPVVMVANTFDEKYLKTKKEKMGHINF